MGELMERGLGGSCCPKRVIFGTINPSSTLVSLAKIVPPPSLWTPIASPSSIPSTSDRSSIAKGLLNRSSFSLMDSYCCFSTAES
ncbi:hypothetical protein RHGRI_014545 [Rhododendron griersonianum]|uniref:Uncharacterized protein n=1 Tax=Rhododendron griersonianum TaxID=479676 RepID=A0AAV6KA11_9ERIC|nr:hypothetical protein RHGRI_014545 [Rhododendron griersonianum]